MSPEGGDEDKGARRHAAQERHRQRVEHKRALLGVHYLDAHGSPQLLFPLHGIEAIRMLGRSVNEGDEGKEHAMQHLIHPVPANVTVRLLMALI